MGSFSVSPTGQIFAHQLFYDHGTNTHGIYWAYSDGTAWTATLRFMQ